MKKLILLSFVVLLIPVVVYGQDKVETPNWNIGDKWIIGGVTTITVVSADESSYTVKYATPKDESTLIYEKSSLNRLFSMDGDNRIPYAGRNRRLFNFPLEIRKSWKDQYMAGRGAASQEYTEIFTPVGWEDIEVQAGKFKAVKLEYKQVRGEEKGGPTAKEGKAWYWYSPDAKYMLKCQYDTTGYWPPSSDWEITSFELKK